MPEPTDPPPANPANFPGDLPPRPARAAFAYPPTPPPVPASHAPPPPLRPRFTFEPMPDGDRPAAALDALLKRPGQLTHRFQHGPAWELVGALLVATLLCLTLYGLTMASFSGGAQWWAVPLKVVLGTAFSALICLPSLYIFTCLSGADITLRALVSVLAAVLCLNALLLVGFAPVAWVFSQSTDSVALVGMLHLIFWLIGAVFAVRLLVGLFDFAGSSGKGYLRLWFAIFLLVCLQMTTALRPLVGKADTFLPTKKLFFLSHWGKTVSGEPE